MNQEPGDIKKYSAADLAKIRKRAREIWKRKCQALNTALDDWLQAERELRTQIGINHKQWHQYTDLEVAKIRVRAQAIREEKVRSLRTAFDDWIEAEQELKEELQKKINLSDLFDVWFGPASDRVTSLIKKDPAIQPGVLDEVLGKLYVKLMASCMN
jgi:lysophospholipase L1-like esterase